MKKFMPVIALVVLATGCDSCGGKKTVTQGSVGSQTAVMTQAESEQTVMMAVAEVSENEGGAQAREVGVGKVSTDTDTGTGTGIKTENRVAKVPKFEVKDLKLGSGPAALEGKVVTIHYVGTFENGIKFDSSIDRESPLTFTLGRGEQIQGWDQGIKGMKVGGKRQLVVPAELGYGATGVKGVIPPHSTLFFEIELLSVK